MGVAEDDEIVLDPEVPGVRVALVPVPVPEPPPPLPHAAGFGDDEWAARLPDGRVVAFLREPVARCHFDRVLLLDGARRIERPLPPWIYYGDGLKLGQRILIGGPRQAWRLDWDGTMTTLLEEPDGKGVQVCWLDDDTAVAAGWQAIVIDGPAGRLTLPCNHAAAACAVAPGLLAVSDDDGTQWIHAGRVVARDWRTISHAAGDVVITAGGEAFRVVLTAASAAND